jgi:DNA-binding NtrC family response regulator
MTSMTAPRILVVDDDQEFQRALVKIFRKAGFKVGAASDGNQAATMLTKARNAFMAMVLDLNLPGKPGLELLREIKAKAPETRIIVITAYGDAASRQSALEAGAFDFLNKPVKRETILEIVKKALDLSK